MKLTLKIFLIKYIVWPSSDNNDKGIPILKRIIKMPAKSYKLKLKIFLIDIKIIKPIVA